MDKLAFAANCVIIIVSAIMLGYLVYTRWPVKEPPKKHQEIVVMYEYYA